MSSSENTSELYIDWNANSISAALLLGEAKILVAAGSHERARRVVRTRVYCRRETNNKTFYVPNKIRSSSTKKLTLNPFYGFQTWFVQ